MIEMSIEKYKAGDKNIDPISGSFYGRIYFIPIQRCFVKQHLSISSQFFNCNYIHQNACNFIDLSKCMDEVRYILFSRILKSMYIDI